MHAYTITTLRDLDPAELAPAPFGVPTGFLIKQEAAVEDGPLTLELTLQP